MQLGRGPRQGGPHKSALPFDVEAIRREFPILSETVHGRPLIYLDSAASAQKPRAVIDAESSVYEHIYANVHRGVHRLSGLATDAYEAVRGKVRARLGGRDDREVIFVRGTTEAINLVAQSWGRSNVGPGDEVLVTGLEHHSNIVPWQMLVAEKGAKLVVAPIDDTGTVDLDAFEKALSPRTRLVALAHVSNALGTVNPVATMAALAHSRGAVVLVDGAQGIPHEPIDVSTLGCDFYAFSAHKAYGPSGVGVLWGRKELLEAMPPWQGGGDMILSCSFAGTTYNDLPVQVRGRHTRHRRCHCHGCRPRLDAPSWDSMPSQPTRRICSPTARRSSPSFQGCASWAPPERRRASFRSSSTGSTPTTSGPFSTTRASP